MNSAQFWDGFRHFLTAAGILATNVPNPYVQAAGLLLSVASASTSVVIKGQDTAPDPMVLSTIAIPPAPSAPAPAKVPTSAGAAQIISVFAVCLFGWAMIGGVGCSSTATSTTPSQANIAAAVTTPVTELLVGPILKRNPTLLPLFQAVADGIETTFVTGTVTNDEIVSFVTALAVRYPQLSDADKQEIIISFQNLLPVYYAFSGQTAFNLSDPNAKQLLEAFRTGIVQGIQLYEATNPAVGPVINVPTTSQIISSPVSAPN